MSAVTMVCTLTDHTEGRRTMDTKREIVHANCAGCPKIEEHGEFKVCSVYPMTSHWWRRGKCPMHPSVLEAKEEEKKSMGWKKSRQKS